MTHATAVSPARPRLRWGLWLSLLLILLAVGEGAGWALASMGVQFAGWNIAVRSIFAVLTLAWWIRGVLLLADRPRARLAVIDLAGTYLAYFFVSLGLQHDNFSLAIAAFGVWALLVMFLGGLGLVRALLRPGWPVVAVARAVIDEAIRMKIALIFIVGVVLIVPVMPFLLDADERLSYRLQFFLTWALGLTSFLLSLMTIFLACGTVAADASRKHWHMTLVKPIRRVSYLAGKWLGIAMLNLVLLGVAGAGVYSFARYLQQQPAVDAQDRFAADYGVLVGRRGVTPVPPPGMDLESQVQTRIETLKRQDPSYYGGEVTRQERQAVRAKVLAQWHSIAPRESQAYMFEGLEPAKQADAPLQLRIKPKASSPPPRQLVQLAFWFNGRAWPTTPEGVHYNPPRIVDDKFHTFDLNPSIIDDQGRLTVRIKNVNLEAPEYTHDASVTFAPNSDIEVLYQVSGFVPNLAKALFVIWIKLGFLAVLGIASASLLSFPIACLLSFLFYFVAIASGFISESLEFFAGLAPEDLGAFETLLWYPQTFVSRIASGEIWDAMRLLIRIVGQGFTLLVPDFSRFAVNKLVADGRVVEWRMLTAALIWIGLIWSGVAALIGAMIFRKRELAKVIV